jgi:FixJ family two-component response regulator
MNETTTIYVVDDDEAVLLSVKAMLGQHGYQSRGYLSAKQFLAEAPTDCPGCVITDLQIPEISGVELQQRLLAANSLLSVVVVTGVADVPTAVALMERGAITLLSAASGGCRGRTNSLRWSVSRRSRMTSAE